MIHYRAHDKQEMIEILQGLDAGETVELAGTNFTFTASESWKELYPGKRYQGDPYSESKSPIKNLLNAGRVIKNVSRSAQKNWNI